MWVFWLNSNFHFDSAECEDKTERGQICKSRIIWMMINTTGMMPECEDNNNVLKNAKHADVKLLFIFAKHKHKKIRSQKGDSCQKAEKYKC